MEKDFCFNVEKKILELTEICKENGQINPELYEKYDVKRGLRDINGKGVLTGLTEIADVHAYEEVDGKTIPCAGQLFYRGYNVKDIIEGFSKDDLFGYEEITYLLLFGQLPTKVELQEFVQLLGEYRKLPPSFIQDVIMKAPSKDMMNALARSVLMLYAYDKKADDTSIPNVIRQSLELIATFPLLAVYGYQAYQHFYLGKSFYIHTPDPNKSTAENILMLLRPDGKYTHLEAKILDIALVLHAEHGGGNNATFTTHVVTSTGTDTYSSVVASLGSLKGPKHGGANIKVIQMFDDLKNHISNWDDEESIKCYLESLLNKQGFDKTGLIYGMGHAIYSISDPREQLLKQYAEKLCKEQGFEKEYKLYTTVERLSAQLIKEKRKIYKGVSANIDFYSGLVYKILGLPMELFTPMFAVARISGWSAHRIEELVNEGRIIRPAYKNILSHKEYIPLEDR